MKPENKKEIVIRPIQNRDRDYLAYFKSEFLGATFCVAFQDTITGAIGLHKFTEMIRIVFNEKNLTFTVSNVNLKIKNKALLDEITLQKKQ